MRAVIGRISMVMIEAVAVDNLLKATVTMMWAKAERRAMAASRVQIVVSVRLGVGVKRQL
jgi:hypothetical protein